MTPMRAERERATLIANAQSAGHRRGRIEAEQQYEAEARRLAAINEGWPVVTTNLRAELARAYAQIDDLKRDMRSIQYAVGLDGERAASNVINAITLLKARP